ncbi:MAG: hypothetical protein S0880_19330 [Actinomycetota bacterium]|nr:hypothetical protein [Actinomycetota bacterium]
MPTTRFTRGAAGALLASVLVLGAAACSDEDDGAGDDVENVDTEGDIGEELDSVGEDIQEGVEDLTDEVDDAVDGLDGTVDEPEEEGETSE